MILSRHSLLDSGVQGCTTEEASSLTPKIRRSFRMIGSVGELNSYGKIPTTARVKLYKGSKGRQALSIGGRFG